jgi:hypothetical protein
VASAEARAVAAKLFAKAVRDSRGRLNLSARALKVTLVFIDTCRLAAVTRA